MARNKEDPNNTDLIIQRIKSADYKELYEYLSADEIRHYLYQLFEALDYCHSKGVMHRDVKPGNLMIDDVKKELTLIDFGLAEFYHPLKEYNLRVATKAFKGPELLVGYKMYDYSLDIWSSGCVFAQMLFRTGTIFRGNEDYIVLDRIAQYSGTEEIYKYIEKYQADFNETYRELIGNYSKFDLKEMINDQNIDVADNDLALDLLQKML